MMYHAVCFLDTFTYPSIPHILGNTYGNPIYRLYVKATSSCNALFVFHVWSIIDVVWASLVL